MKIKARVIALGHMGDVEFGTLPHDSLLDNNRIEEERKLQLELDL